VQSSGARGDAGAGAAGGDTVSAAPPRGGGGSSERRVEPQDERLSPAAQRPSSSAASESTGTGSIARCSGFNAAASPSRSPTTTPTRARPWSGALTRWPRATTSPGGTTYENAWPMGMSKTTSAITEWADTRLLLQALLNAGAQKWPPHSPSPRTLVR